MTSATAAIVNLVASTLAAFATIVLAWFAKRQWRAMKESNEAAERQNELARGRWKHEDRFKRLLWLDNRFNSPAMLIARSKLGEEMIKKNPDLSTILRMPKGPAWPAIYFFMQIAQMWKRELLDLDDIAVAFGDYVNILGVTFENHLKNELLQGKFDLLLELINALWERTDFEFELKRSTSGISAADIDFVRSEFWQREAALFRDKEKI